MSLHSLLGVLHSFSIKNIFYDKMELRLFYFHVTIYTCHLFFQWHSSGKTIIKWIEVNQLTTTFPEIIKNHGFSDNFGGNRSWLIHWNPFYIDYFHSFIHSLSWVFYSPYIKSDIWRWTLTGFWREKKMKNELIGF